MSHLLSFETLQNTRDLGGMQTRDGRKIKSGKLIRSGRLSGISLHDREILSGLLDTVVDFRDKAERMEYPDVEIEGVANIQLPLLETLAAGVTRDVKSERDILAKTINNPENTLKMICGIYTSFIVEEHAVSQYRKFLQILMENHDKAVLWHCSAGKDRAGIGSVLVEEILGVPREDIIADYMNTNDYLESMAVVMEHVKRLMPGDAGISPEALQCLFFAKREYIDAYYQAVQQKYGDFSTFLSKGLQMTEADIRRMQELYLENT